MFENTINKQQMIHMAAEVVILLGVIFYFNQKNRRLSSQIEDLIQRVEEQEDTIQKHEQLLQKIALHLNSKVSVPDVAKSTPRGPRPAPKPKPEPAPTVTFSTETFVPSTGGGEPDIFEENSSSSENENEFVEELQEELQELDNEEALKKT